MTETQVKLAYVKIGRNYLAHILKNVRTWLASGMAGSGGSDDVSGT